MAAIETLKTFGLTFDRADEPGDLTTPRKLPCGMAPDGHGGVAERRGRLPTFPEVDPEERGEENLQDEAGVSWTQFQAVRPEDTPDRDGESARLRSELARDVLHHVEQVIPLIGDVALPTHIQLLRRELSRCHDELKGRPGESPFLSIVTLVEAALAQQKWKQFTGHQLEQIRLAIDVGYRQMHVTFADYDRVRRELAAQKVDTHPRINLESVSLDDIEDDEDG